MHTLAIVGHPYGWRRLMMKQKLRSIWQHPKFIALRVSLGGFWERSGFAVVLLFCAGIIGMTVFLTKDADPAAKLPASPTPVPTLAALVTVRPPNVDVLVSTPTPAPPPLAQPVEGMLERAYSMESLIYYEPVKEWGVHGGIDWVAEEGTEVYAAADGVVQELSWDVSWGNVVLISHDNGLVTGYASLADTLSVSVGDVVKRGQAIGQVGESATRESDLGNHLHFYVEKDGVVVNPADYLP